MLRSIAWTGSLPASIGVEKASGRNLGVLACWFGASGSRIGSGVMTGVSRTCLSVLRNFGVGSHSGIHVLTRSMRDPCPGLGGRAYGCAERRARVLSSLIAQRTIGRKEDERGVSRLLQRMVTPIACAALLAAFLAIGNPTTVSVMWVGMVLAT